MYTKYSERPANRNKTKYVNGADWFESYHFSRPALMLVHFRLLVFCLLRRELHNINMFELMDTEVCTIDKDSPKTSAFDIHCGYTKV